MESSTANRKTAAEAIDILATAYGSSSYFEKTTDQIVEMKNMVSRIPVRPSPYYPISIKNIPHRSKTNIFTDLFG